MDWELTPTAERRLKVLEGLYDDPAIGIDELASLAGVSSNEVPDLLRAGSNDGYVGRGLRMSSPSQLTAPGREHVEGVRARRLDRNARRRACRNAVLKKIDEVGGHSYMADWRGSAVPRFLSDEFTEDEIGEAADYLLDKGLIRALDRRRPRQANGKLLLVELTADGRDCLTESGGDVAEHLTPKPSAPTNYFGTVNGPVAVGDGNRQVVVNNAFMSPEITEILEQLRRIADQIEDGEQRDDYLQAVGEVEAAVEAGDQPSLRRRLRMLGALTVGSAYGGLVGARAEELAQLVGGMLT